MGKSTVVLQLLAAQAEGGADCLYVTGEESAAQVAARAKRLGAVSGRLRLLAEASLPRILTVLADQRPSLCVVDSIQTMTDPASPSAPGFQCSEPSRLSAASPWQPSQATGPTSMSSWQPMHLSWKTTRPWARL